MGEDAFAGNRDGQEGTNCRKWIPVTRMEKNDGITVEVGDLYGAWQARYFVEVLRPGSIAIPKCVEVDVESR